jgi:ketosteroid isomerase-like protein
MTTTLECFERGTKSFNSHDVEGFAAVLADDVVFEAPGGMRGHGKSACAGFFSGWWAAFPDAQVEVHDLHIIDDVAVEVGTFTGTHHGTSAHRPATYPRPAVRSAWGTPRYCASETAGMRLFA